MSFFELYRMNIPLLVPSLRLLLAWHREHNFLWERVYGRPPPLHAAALESGLDPNADDPAAVAEWLAWSDMYQFPHIIYFGTLASMQYPHTV